MVGNSFGKLFKITTFGESHGKAIGVVIDGCPSNLEITEKDIQAELNRRKPGQSKIATERKENDKVEILSGIFKGKTTGTPIALVIKNTDTDSSEYEKIKDLFRPGHADYTFFKKFGIRDFRGGGRASARETVARVAAGAIAKKILSKKGIKITGHVIQVYNVKAKKFDVNEIEKNSIRCADKNAAKEMEKIILKAKKEGDSLGGIIEIKVTGTPIGFGEPVFDKLDAVISHALMSIPSVKGVEIGIGFEAVNLKGLQNNDEMFFDKKQQEIKFKTNNAGGILGGISNGEEIIVKFVVKPVSSIKKIQRTVDLNGNEKSIEIQGRHDSCIAPRAVPVGEAMIALVLVDMLLIQNFK
ncbi:chorismate synthase [Candidatus Micrarchaeota archaeon]|nr:chorismate synthase [Candidatus Micrarchaeota archaeon]